MKDKVSVMRDLIRDLKLKTMPMKRKLVMKKSGKNRWKRKRDIEKRGISKTIHSLKNGRKRE